MDKPLKTAIVSFIALAVCVFALMVWVIASSPQCPEGQSLKVVGYIPVTSGKVQTMQPMYGCEE